MEYDYKGIHPAHDQTDIYLSPQDREDLLESAGLLIDSLINCDPMRFMHPDFHESVHRETSLLLQSQTLDLCNDHIIDDVVSDAFSTYYAHVYPRRSYDKTFIRMEPNKAALVPQLQTLRDVPQPDQRTPEWYAFRHNYLTASSAWKVFMSDSTRNQLIYDKCVPYDPNKYKGTVAMESPLQWGVRYEPVSIAWYEKEFNTTIEDFGCIPHPTLACLAASPDGINTDLSSSRFGRMLEVKNIVNREINGIPKLEYWTQMQLQMEVCGLNECDFLETRFKEYESAEDSAADGTFRQTADGRYKGIIMCFNDAGSPVYEYPPFDVDKAQYDEWEGSIMAKHENITWVSNLYWHLAEVSCILVLRNKLWFTSAEPGLKGAWKSVETDRKNGYEHRAPRRKSKIDKVSPKLGPIGCFINTDTLVTGQADCNVTPALQESDNKVISIMTECLDNG